MEFSIKSGSPEKQRSACVVVGVFDSRKLTLPAELIDKARSEYAKTENAEFARQASLQERDGYANREQGYARVRPAKPRIEEILDFIGKMGYRKIGLAFCLGLRSEAMIVELSGRRHCVAHAASPGYETYATGWHSLILQAF